VVEPTHPGSSPRLGTGAPTFLAFSMLSGDVLSVADYMPIHYKATVVLHQSQDLPALSLGGAHRRRGVCPCL
jgi:hypothetical protein